MKIEKIRGSSYKVTNPSWMQDYYYSYSQLILLVDWNEKKIHINIKKYSVTTSRHTNIFKSVDHADVERKKARGWTIVESVGLDVPSSVAQRLVVNQ